MSTNFDPRFLEDLAKRLSDAVPPQLAALRSDFETNFKSVLQAGRSKLDLVTRQEFDVQSGVLARTREKLTALEERLAAMEAQLGRFERNASERVEPPTPSPRASSPAAARPRRRSSRGRRASSHGRSAAS